jgi:hypothetical protein
MRILLGVVHTLVALMLLGAGITVLGDYWKTPALVLLAGGTLACSIGMGMFARARWVRWVIGPLVAVVTLMAVFMFAGSVMWPESAVSIIISAYVVFLALELATWLEAGRSFRGSRR